MGRRVNAAKKIESEAVLKRHLAEVNSLMKGAVGVKNYTAAASLMRVKLEVQSQVETLASRRREAEGDTLSEEEFLDALEVSAREMPDDHLQVFVEEWASRGKAYPPAPRP